MPRRSAISRRLNPLAASCSTMNRLAFLDSGCLECFREAKSRVNLSNSVSSMTPGFFFQSSLIRLGDPFELHGKNFRQLQTEPLNHAFLFQDVFLFHVLSLAEDHFVLINGLVSLCMQQGEHFIRGHK
jgi:hypothetical protein